MSIKRISDKMEEMLNKQITREAHASQVFLAYASWADTKKYSGTAEFFYKHAVEERDHMKKFIDYVNTRGGEVKIEAIPAPPTAPTDLEDCLKKTLKHEIENSEAINNIVNLAFEEKDWATFNFGQWFVQEQVEEEALVMDLLDKYALAIQQKDGYDNLYDLDKDLKSTSQHVSIPGEN